MLYEKGGPWCTICNSIRSQSRPVKGGSRICACGKSGNTRISTCWGSTERGPSDVLLDSKYCSGTCSDNGNEKISRSDGCIFLSHFIIVSLEQLCNGSEREQHVKGFIFFPKCTAGSRVNLKTKQKHGQTRESPVINPMLHYLPRKRRQVSHRVRVPRLAALLDEMLFISVIFLSYRVR